MTKLATEERVAHTPTPWILGDGAFVYALYIPDRNRSYKNGHVQQVNRFSSHVSRDGSEATDKELNANAAFIVTACNAHEALVDALRAAEEWLDGRGALTSEEIQSVVRAALSLATQKENL